MGPYNTLMFWPLLAIVCTWTLLGLLFTKAAARASGNADPRAAALVFFLWPAIAAVTLVVIAAWGFLWVTGQALLFLINERKR